MQLSATLRIGLSVGLILVFGTVTALAQWVKVPHEEIPRTFLLPYHSG